MTQLKSLIFLSFVLFVNCAPDDDDPKLNALGGGIQTPIDSYVGNSIDLFSQELEQEGGFIMWKNYRDYLGLGKIGFKERMHHAWNRSFDPETLAFYINTELAKNHSNVTVTINKRATDIDQYAFALLFPVVAIVMEEFLLWFILLLLVEFVIIPFVAKRTLRNSRRTGSIFKDVLYGFLAEPDRQQRIAERVSAIRQTVHIVLMVVFVIFTMFYYDFNESLNKTLKQNIKEKVFENIVIHGGKPSNPK